MQGQVLPENIIRWMTAADRRKHLKGQYTIEETIDRASKAEERELHNNFTYFLNRMELQYCHSTWGKKATIQPGIPDFHVWKGRRHCFVEFKGEFGRLSEIQKEVIGKMTEDGTPILVTSVYLVAVHFTLLELGLDQLRVNEGAYPDKLGLQETSRHGSKIV